MALRLATLQDVTTAGAPQIPVQFNPTDYGIDDGANYAQMPVPGLQTPIQQFIRGESRHLSLELFLDSSDIRGGPPPATPTSPADPNSVKKRLEDIRSFVKIARALHSPPVCRFLWGDLTFTGVVISIREKFLLFSDQGTVLRARVTLTFREYKSAEVQLRELAPESPDRTHVRVMREGETLSHLSHEAYGDPRNWRAIAEANDIDRPRFVPPGSPLKVPSL